MDWRKYGVYHARWQASTVVMAIPITLFERIFSPVVALAFAQVIGACVFWYVDGWIFEESGEA
jgi:hypothetical protein